MKKSIYVLSAVALLLPVFSQASSWIPSTTIENVRWFQTHGFITVQDESNPECPGSVPTKHKIIYADNPGHEQIMTMALAAMLSGKQVEISVSGCQTNAGNEYSVVHGIVVK